jgi:hypothetical protein
MRVRPATAPPIQIKRPFPDSILIHVLFDGVRLQAAEVYWIGSRSAERKKETGEVTSSKLFQWRSSKNRKQFRSIFPAAY